MRYRYCNNCGASNPATNAFCQECGSSMNNMNNMNSAAPQYAQPQMIRKKSRSKLIVILPIVIGVMLLAAGSVFAYFQFFAKTEVDIVKDFDDTVLEITGYDGEGEIQEIKEDVIRQKLAYYDADDEVKEFIDDIQYTTDKDDDCYLSNGSKVTIIAHYDQNYADEHNLKIKNANYGKVEKTIKLDGFQEKEEEDTEEEPVYEYDTPNKTTPDYSSNSNQDYYDERETMDDGAYYRVSDEYLTDDDVKNWDEEKTQTWINYIYAKNGYVFKKNKKQKEHFESMDWYNNRVGVGASDEEIRKNLTGAEKNNYDVLTKHRSKLKN